MRKRNQRAASAPSIAVHAGRLDDDEECGGEGRPSILEKVTFELLQKRRTVLISETITSELTKRLIPQLLWLDTLANDPITVILNTAGGAADDGFAIHDFLKFVNSPVATVCAGLTASAGTIILLAAPRERRFTLPNTRLMIHQPAGGARGQASDIEITANEIVRLRQRANELLAKECGKTLKEVEKDTNRDHWLSAEESVKYGLCGSIVTTWEELDNA